MPATGEKYFFVSSLAKGLSVLELLAEHDELSVSEVAHHLGFNRAGSHRFLATLRELGYVEQTAQNRYRLTFKLFRMGSAVVGRFEILRMAQPLMSELSRAFGETVNLGYLDGTEVLHIDKIDSPEVLRMDSPVGTRAPLYCTGLGKAMLGFLPEDERDRILEAIELKPQSPRTITSRETLLKELHHRVKNNLNLISSYLNLQALETDSPELEERNEALSSRINAISLVHEKLQSSDTFLYFEIGPYLEDLCNKIIAGSSLQEATFSADIRATVEVSSKQAIYLGLIIAEFTLNSLKHAAADEELQIDLKVDLRDGQLLLSYYDNGEPFPEDFDLSESSSLGLMVVGRLVAQLDGRLDYDFSISKEIRIIVPLEEAEAAASL